jgi:transcriptional regulator GlxA family with amidase domain
MMKRLFAVAPLALALVIAGCLHTPSGSGSSTSDAHGGGGAAAVAFKAPAVNMKEGAKNVGIVLVQGLFITEYTAPFDIYAHCGYKVNVFTVAESLDPIITYENVALAPNFTFADSPKIDILVVPSGINSMEKDLTNEALIGFVKKHAAAAEWVTSHCWGAYTLGKCGLLDGKECTTFPGYTDGLQKQNEAAKVVTDRRFVVEGNIVTSGGGLAAYEAALFVVEKAFDAELAKKVGDGLVFAPQNFAYAQDPRKEE